MSQNLPGLIILSLLAFIAGAIAFIPGSDWGPLLVHLPLIILLAFILYQGGIKAFDASFPPALFTLAFTTRLLGILARFWMLVALYGGAGDAVGYLDQGQYLASFFKERDFSILEYYEYRGGGTQNLAIITGLVYTILPASMASSYFFFGMLAFAATVFFYGAFRLTFPEARPDMYRFIIFFLPSVLFWPSCLGKEAWIFFNSGFVAYGLAKYMRLGHFSGLILAVIGLLLISLVRPHFTAFMVIAIIVAYLIGFQRLLSQQHPVTWMLAGGILVGGLMFIGPATQQVLGIDELSLEELEGGYQGVLDQTSQGGSGFEVVSIFSPRGFVIGIVTVLFRPFLWEARGAAMLGTALESFVWLALVWVRRKTFLARVRVIHKDPWTAFLVAYSLIAILALTSFGNFGILARQRVLFLPFFWMLFA